MMLCYSRVSTIFLLINGVAVLERSLHVQAQCVENLMDIHQQELQAEQNDQLDVERTYYLCPGQKYRVATVTIDYYLLEGQRPLTTRPNLRVLCGEDGKLENDCTLSEGTMQVDATKYFSSDIPATNVIFRGITFEDSRKYNVWGNKAGDVTFIDCEFKGNRKSRAPILLDHLDEENTGDILKMTFVNCIFNDNRYFGEGAFPSVITVNGVHNELVVDSSYFVNNDMEFNNTLSNTSSFLIESSGKVEVKNSCFVDNLVGVAPVVAYGSNKLELFDNYGANTEGRTCELGAVFETSKQFFNFDPGCFEFDVDDGCAIGGAEETPTIGPTLSPSALGSALPTEVAPVTPDSAVPTSKPSISPVISSSSSPSTTSSSVPTSSSITVLPTSSPSLSGEFSSNPSVKTSAPTVLSPPIAPSVSIPTSAPSVSIPTSAPSVLSPTISPASNTTSAPASNTTSAPTLALSMVPSSSPTSSPTLISSSNPSFESSSNPTLRSSGTPSAKPILTLSPTDGISTIMPTKAVPTPSPATSSPGPILTFSPTIEPTETPAPSPGAGQQVTASPTVPTTVSSPSPNVTSAGAGSTPYLHTTSLILFVSWCVSLLL